MSNGNRNNVAECGSGTVATVSESRKAQEGDVEWIWETETLTVGFIFLSLSISSGCSCRTGGCKSRFVSLNTSHVTLSVRFLTPFNVFVSVLKGAVRRARAVDISQSRETFTGSIVSGIKASL